MKNNSFTIIELSLPGVLRIEPHILNDERGFSVNVSLDKVLSDRGITTSFTQDLSSYSRKDVLRGLHFQHSPHTQNKLVRCVNGKIFDVTVDCDKQSPTFGQHVSVTLKGDEQILLYIPGIYAHGYCVLSDGAVVESKLGAYNPELMGGARFDDPIFNINWPITNPILSKTDKSWPSLT